MHGKKTKAKPTLESQIERSCCKYLKRKGFLAIKLTGIKGVPDRLVIGNDSVIFFVEFKTYKGKLSKHQKFFKRILKHMGFRVLVIRSLEQMKGKIK